MMTLLGCQKRGTCRGFEEVNRFNIQILLCRFTKLQRSNRRLTNSLSGQRTVY